MGNSCHKQPQNVVDLRDTKNSVATDSNRTGNHSMMTNAGAKKIRKAKNEDAGNVFKYGGKHRSRLRSYCSKGACREP